MKQKIFALALLLIAGLVGSAAVARADTYDDLFHWVDWMAQKYGMGNVYVGEAYLPDGVYGESQGRTIVFNKAYVDRPGRLAVDIAQDVAYGYHPGKGCTPTQVVAVHESAHVLDNITGHTAQYELATALKNGLSGEVSGYSFDQAGNVNIPEALADAMVAVECDTPTPAETALYTMLTT